MLCIVLHTINKDDIKQKEVNPYMTPHKVFVQVWFLATDVRTAAVLDEGRATLQTCKHEYLAASGMHDYLDIIPVQPNVKSQLNYRTRFRSEAERTVA
jgi:hypothetical protein